MNLIKNKSSPNHYNGRFGWKADMIVCHQTGGSELAPALNWYLNPNAQCSPNWVIDTNGDIYELVSPENAAYCNGTTTKSGNLYYKNATSAIVKSRATNANYYTYSFECVHCAHGDITAEQVTAIVELIKNVIIPDMIKNGATPKIDREHLIGHCEINPITRSFCPGKNFPYDEIISRVNGMATSTDNGGKSKSVSYIMQACSLAAIRNKPSKSGKLLGRVAMLTQVDERGKSNQHRLDEAEADIKELQEKNNALYEMNANIRTLSEGILSVKTDVQEIRVEQGEMKSDITDLKNAPHKSKARAFDTAWKFIVTAVGGAFIGWVITMLIPQIAG